ncbi:hypothetical protein [Gallaecimonas sp. GXIMD4217]|uniref:DUF6942 family protein n=1 Tax=Gallaecimonas sp. GXIMD4217 TaxID=3131927 RepID=UPI00311B26C3
MRDIGLGDGQYRVAVYVAKGPPMAELQGLDELRPLVGGEIDHINAACGNGWRKLFNVYAKVLFALPDAFGFAEQAPTWQRYRDERLLQPGSTTALLLSPPRLGERPDVLHIIAGRTHARDLLARGELQAQLTWLDEEFAICPEHRLLVCPYFDYRQLSNSKIARLSELVAAMA